MSAPELLAATSLLIAFKEDFHFLILTPELSYKHNESVNSGNFRGYLP